jgi:hypothetical protein
MDDGDERWTTDYRDCNIKISSEDKQGPARPSLDYLPSNLGTYTPAGNLRPDLRVQYSVAR